MADGGTGSLLPLLHCNAVHSRAGNELSADPSMIYLSALYDRLYKVSTLDGNGKFQTSSP